MADKSCRSSNSGHHDSIRDCFEATTTSKWPRAFDWHLIVRVELAAARAPGRSHARASLWRDLKYTQRAKMHVQQANERADERASGCTRARRSPSHRRSKKAAAAVAAAVAADPRRARFFLALGVRRTAALVCVRPLVSHLEMEHF